MNSGISRVEDSEVEEISALVNSAYRGESSRAGWATEEELVGGQRTDPVTLREDLAQEGSRMLALRESLGGPIVACVFLQLKAQGVCYLGMLTVKPAAQSGGIGRALLEYSENYAQQWGAQKIVMTVISVREALIAWYERRGYRQTGETAPFPYGDVRFGIPKVEGLYFVVMEKKLGPAAGITSPPVGSNPGRR